MGIRILTDSTCDMPLEYIHQHSALLDVVGMPIHIDTKDFIDDMGQTVPHQEFYDMLRQGKMATTSQISPMEISRAGTGILAMAGQVEREIRSILITHRELIR